MTNDATYKQFALPGMTCAAAIVIAKPAIALAGLLVVGKVKVLEPS